MRWVPVVAIALALGVLAAACGGDGGEPPTPAGPTTLSLTKSMEETGEGEYRFTLLLTNEGDNAAINLALSDVWEDGLEVTSIHPVEGYEPEDIGDFGLEVLIGEFGAGETVDVAYTARCRESGQWENTAAATSGNSDGAMAAVTVVCP